MRYLFIFLLTALLASCDKEKQAANTEQAPSPQQYEPVEPGTGIPACVQKKLDDTKLSDGRFFYQLVYEYAYKGKRVYLFISRCCDFPNPLFDENCNYLCAPTGGFSGGGDGKCRDFTKEAVLLRIVFSA